MASANDWQRLASLTYMRSAIDDAALLTTLLALPAIQATAQVRPIEWNHPLFVASLISSEAPADLQDSALRIVQACIQDPLASPAQKAAAQVLLQSWGNQRAIDLARSKQLVDVRDVEVPFPLQLDLIRREFELTIRSAEGSRIRANDFQRRFWDAASRSRWVSVSAPTSVGKSFIVRKWIEGLQSGKDEFTAVYVVPTRALIDEVSAELREELKNAIDIFELPWDGRIADSKRRIFVLTQERLHLLMDRAPSLSVDLMFIDEAQKFDDGRRGILLQRVLDEVIDRAPDAQVIFASPLAANPGLLIERSPGTSESLLSEVVTVNQNLVYVNQHFGKPLAWRADLVIDGRIKELGTFSIAHRPNSTTKRLAFVAVALGNDAANVVYVNGAAEAEKVANNIFESLPVLPNDALDSRIVSLIELVEKTIHTQYLLATTLRRGVAFHYGNMPLLVREAIEGLFREGVIKYLVCTSTLLEGVNLPCQNIFIRGPRKGNKNPMAPADFWNLAGRAGRWGREFQGTIVCVDTSQDGTWDSVPLRKERAPIVRATDKVLGKFGSLMSYIQSGATVAESRADPELESMFSLIAASPDPRSNLAHARWMSLSEASLDELLTGVAEAMADVTLTRELIARHAGISPLSLQRLSDYLTAHENTEELPLSPPESNDASISLVRAMSRIDTYLGGDFSDFGGRRWQLAILLVSWMRGRPLSVLIADRMKYVTDKGRNTSLATTIRSVLHDVEQIARFQAPLYLTAYVDVLRAVHPELYPDDELTPDIAMMLELGVSRTTELSMMSLGISRTATVAIGELIVEDNLTADEVITWLRSRNLGSLGLPVLIVQEVTTLLNDRPMYE